jgi:hypothetical protein
MFAKHNKKKNALFASERERDCVIHTFSFMGNVPCTGPEVCNMCGLRKDDCVTAEMMDRINGAIEIAFNDLKAWEFSYAKRPTVLLRMGIQSRQELFEALQRDKQKMLQKHLIYGDTEPIRYDTRLTKV